MFERLLRMKKFILLFGLALAISLPIAINAQEKKSPDVLLEEGVKMVLQAIELILKTIPEYQAPEILDNGDIIIRRVNPKNQKPKDGLLTCLLFLVAFLVFVVEATFSRSSFVSAAVDAVEGVD